MNGKVLLYAQPVLAAARQFVFAPLDYQFSQNEIRVLRLFFTNLNRRVFFMHTLPANVGASLLAMFSRIKNRRGIRGVFVDSFLPQFLATQLSEVDDEVLFLKKHNVRTLDQYVALSAQARQSFEVFVSSMGVDPDYLQAFANSKKTRSFLNMWLDVFGHNSIARGGAVWLCFEQISLLAAKSIEWGRPGAGYIELSTRYVNMQAAACYPIAQELLLGWNIPIAPVQRVVETGFELYERLAGQKSDGPFPTFLRQRYVSIFQGRLKDLEAGVFGETCDVLGNLLPCSALTSVGVCVSGEALPNLLKHLLLDQTPENIALVELIIGEAPKIGAEQFIRHFEPTAWDYQTWRYLPTAQFKQNPGQMMSWNYPVMTSAAITNTLAQVFKCTREEFLEMIESYQQRGTHDKLPREFETVSLPFDLVMSFRGWRDLQRMGFCTHRRTLLSPELGFYQYDKPAPPKLQQAFEQLSQLNGELYAYLQHHGVPAFLCQYPLALGNLVGCTISANLRQWEFADRQRSSWNANHEVRQAFLAVERELRQTLSWWPKVSRADTTEAYVFARGSQPVPLNLE